MPSETNPGDYSLATGEAAVRRLRALHRVCESAGRRVLLRAGLQPGMKAVDFGCGVGATTRMLAEMVGPSGYVTGVDLSAGQLEQARTACEAEGWTNTTFIEASANESNLPRESFDLAYCRYLLLHLVDPADCLREMLEILKPGGILVVEDGDVTSTGSTPESSLRWCADLFRGLGPQRGVDYAISHKLYHLVKAAGVEDPDVEMYRPVMAKGEERFLLKWSVEEAASAFVGAGLVTHEEMSDILSAMDRDTKNPDILVLGPPMSLVWGRKPLR